VTASWVPGGARTRLVLVRHGATAHSADKRFSGRNDLPLNDLGAGQAAALARRAASFGAAAAVVSSPLVRTVQTATAIADALALPLRTVDDLAECDFGEWEGLTFAEVRAAHGAALAAWTGSPDVAPPGGESFAAVGARVTRARDAMLTTHAGTTVVVVTHVTPIKLLVQAALGAPPAAMFRLFLDTASVSIVDYSGDGGATLRLFNDTSHLG
jgi:probable phosphoglycerate mutase